MVDGETLRDLFRHMEWADAAVWGAVFASEDAQADKKLRGYLYHLHGVQRVFLKTWRGEAPAAAYPNFDDARSLMRWAREYYAEAGAHLASVGDEELARPLIVPWSSGVEEWFGRKAADTTFGETALQVALHSTYHRGQVNARLREVGAEPAMTDYIAWLWLGRPEPSWP
jgi:uncharacterized damage-inducible protein DinB